MMHHKLIVAVALAAAVFAEAPPATQKQAAAPKPKARVAAPSAPKAVPSKASPGKAVQPKAPAAYKYQGHRQGEPRLRREGPYFAYPRAPVAAAAQLEATRAATAVAEGLYGAEVTQKFRNGMKKQGGKPMSPAEALVPAVRKALKKKKLTLAFAGMSTAEGIGNYLNESWPYVIQRLVGPAFAAAGVETWTSNFALGATHSRPHPSFCVAGTFGKDVDAAFWWFDMTENGSGGPEAFAIGLTRAYGNIPITIASNNPSGRVNGAAKGAAGPVFSYSMNSGIGIDKALDKNPNCVQALMAPEGQCDKDRYHVHSGDAQHRKGCGGQVSWHVGWNTHQAYGTGIALAWLDALTLVQTGAKVPDLPVVKPPPPPAANDGLLRAELYAGLACATSYRPHAGRGVHTLLDKAQRKAVEGHRLQSKALLHGKPRGPNVTESCSSGHPEWKGSLAVSRDMGPVTFVLPKAKRGRLVVCEPLTLMSGHIFMAPAFDGKRDFSKINLEGIKWSVGNKSLDFQAIRGNGKPQHCYKSEPVLANRLTVEIVGDKNKDPDRYLSISHIIWPSDDVTQ